MCKVILDPAGCTYLSDFHLHVLSVWTCGLISLSFFFWLVSWPVFFHALVDSSAFWECLFKHAYPKLYSRIRMKFISFVKWFSQTQKILKFYGSSYLCLTIQRFAVYCFMLSSGVSLFVFFLSTMLKKKNSFRAGGVSPAFVSPPMWCRYLEHGSCSVSTDQSLIPHHVT